MLSIPVINLIRDSKHNLQLELLAGKKGLNKKISIPRIQKPGLALTGDISHIHPGRIEILGRSEMRYLKSLTTSKLKTIIEKISKVNISCFILTHNTKAPEDLIATCEKKRIPLLRTKLLTSTFINRTTKFLEESLTETTCIHGVLLDVFGVGILIAGKSGVGKSECALDLILRGHRLVADDIINVKKQPPSALFGTGSEIIKYHMEIRGLGIINIKDLFGISTVRDKKLIELVIELTEWDPNAEYDRLGLDELSFHLLDINLPLIQLPVRPGRNLSAIIEVAARNHLLKLGGHHSAREFQEKLNQELIAIETTNEKLKGLLE